jgi:hypothetical protein
MSLIRVNEKCAYCYVFLFSFSGSVHRARSTVHGVASRFLGRATREKLRECLICFEYEIDNVEQVTNPYARRL